MGNDKDRRWVYGVRMNNIVEERRYKIKSNVRKIKNNKFYMSEW